MPDARRLPESALVVAVAAGIVPNTSVPTFCTPAADRRLFISSSTEAAAVSNALFDTLCRGRGEPNKNGSLRGMPTFSCLLGSLGAGENKSCTLFEGFGYAFAELTRGCEDPALPVSGNLDFAWLCFATSNSSTGRTGYNRSEGSGWGESGHTGTPHLPGLPITRSNGGSTGLSCGVPCSGDRAETVFNAETRRMVVLG